MGYWGWRRLLAAFLSVWITGCTTTSDTALSIPPTHYPPVTLTVQFRPRSTPTSGSIIYKAPTLSPDSPTITYKTQSEDTWESVALRFGVEVESLKAANPQSAGEPLRPGQAVVIVAPAFTQDGRPTLPTTTPPELPLAPPTCFAVPTNEIVCYGVVENTLPVVLERVTVRLYLFRENGSILAQAETGLEQSFVLPGLPAPYHVRFAADWDEYAGVQTILTAATPLENSVIVPLTVETLTIQPVDTLHDRVFMTLVNPAAQPVTNVRVIVILYDEAQRVTSYRVMETSDVLGANAAVAVQVDVFLPAAVQHVTPVVYALAMRTSPE
ncbi:MAG: LysM peptidoglycan-binding domain-containing protein [Anaerolineaceae bacterium]|nr:LysM peptidoglycan-binding domain-containing protein [Anaerolineaceae bacterium]